MYVAPKQTRRPFPCLLILSIFYAPCELHHIDDNMLLYIDDTVAGELEGPVPAAPVPVVHPLGPGPAPPHQVPLPRYIYKPLTN